MSLVGTIFVKSTPGPLIEFNHFENAWWSQTLARFILPANVNANRIWREFHVTPAVSQRYSQVSWAELNCWEYSLRIVWRQHSLRIRRKYDKIISIVCIVLIIQSAATLFWSCTQCCCQPVSVKVSCCSSNYCSLMSHVFTSREWTFPMPRVDVPALIHRHRVKWYTRNDLSEYNEMRRRYTQRPLRQYRPVWRLHHVCRYRRPHAAWADGPVSKLHEGESGGPSGEEVLGVDRRLNPVVALDVPADVDQQAGVRWNGSWHSTQEMFLEPSFREGTFNVPPF